jgi:signal transduction histidine kinase
MQSNVERLEAFVETMKRLERLEDFEPEKKPIAAGELLAGLRESAEALRGNKTLVWTAELTASELIHADGAVISEVFENMITNAARYAKQTVAVTVARPATGTLTLTISDDGPGFETKLAENGVRPFYTAGGDGHLGIGLYVCKVLCEKHGGKIEIANTGIGARTEASFST